MESASFKFKPTSQPIFSNIRVNHVEDCLARLRPPPADSHLGETSNYVNDDLLNLVAGALFQTRRLGILYISSGTLIERNPTNVNTNSSRPCAAQYFESSLFSGDILSCNLPLHDSILCAGSPRIVVFPINSNGTHWSVAVYYRETQLHSSDEANTVIYYYDSIPSKMHPLSYIGELQEQLLNRLILSKNQPSAMGKTPCFKGDDPDSFICHDSKSIDIETVDIPAQNEGWECGIFVLMILDMIVQRATTGDYSPIDSSCDFSHFTNDGVLRMQARMRKKISDYSECLTFLYEKIFDSFPEIQQQRYHLVNPWFGIIGSTPKSRTPKLNPAKETIRTIAPLSSFIGDITFRDFVNFLIYSKVSHKMLTYLCSRSTYSVLYSDAPRKKNFVWHYSLESFFSVGNDCVSRETIHFLVTFDKTSRKLEDIRYVLLVLYCGKCILYDPSSSLTNSLSNNIMRKISQHYRVESDSDNHDRMRNSLRGVFGWVDTHFDSVCVIFLLAEYTAKAGNILASDVAENILLLFTKPSFEQQLIQPNLKKYLVSLLNTDYFRLVSKKLYFTRDPLLLDDEPRPRSRERLNSNSHSDTLKIRCFIKKPLHTDLISGYASKMKYHWKPPVFFSCTLSDILCASSCSVPAQTGRKKIKTTTQSGSFHFSLDNSRWKLHHKQLAQEFLVNIGEVIDLCFPCKEIVNLCAYDGRATDAPAQNLSDYWISLLSSVPSLEISISRFDLDISPFKESPKMELRRGLFFLPSHRNNWNGFRLSSNWEECYSRNPDFWKFHCDCTEFVLMEYLAKKDTSGLISLLKSIPHVLVCDNLPLGNCISMKKENFVKSLFKLLSYHHHPSPEYIFGSLLLLYPICITEYHKNRRESNSARTEIFSVVSATKLAGLTNPDCRNGWFSRIFYGSDYPQSLVDNTCYSRSSMMLNLLPRPSASYEEIRKLREMIHHNINSHHCSPRSFGSAPHCTESEKYSEIDELYGIRSCRFANDDKESRIVIK